MDKNTALDKYMDSDTFELIITSIGTPDFNDAIDIAAKVVKEKYDIILKKLLDNDCFNVAYFEGVSPEYRNYIKERANARHVLNFFRRLNEHFINDDELLHFDFHFDWCKIYFTKFLTLYKDKYNYITKLIVAAKENSESVYFAKNILEGENKEVNTCDVFINKLNEYLELYKNALFIDNNKDDNYGKQLE